MKAVIVGLSLMILSSLAYGKNYGLKVGEKAPQIVTKDMEGKTFNLKKDLKAGPTILVFYRGGWCPYCNKQLRDIQKRLLPVAKKHKASVVAISVDLIQEGLKTTKDNKLGFVVLSDSKAKALKDYKVDYKLPADLVKKYKDSYGIDVEASSGEKHHIIAVPAVYVVDQTQKIRYAFVDENYKVRAKVKEVKKALEGLGRS